MGGEQQSGAGSADRGNTPEQFKAANDTLTAAQSFYLERLSTAEVPEGFLPIEILGPDASEDLIDSATMAMADAFRRDPTYLCWLSRELRERAEVDDPTVYDSVIAALHPDMEYLIRESIADPETIVTIIRAEDDPERVVATAIVSFAETGPINLEPSQLPTEADGELWDSLQAMTDEDVYGPEYGEMAWLAYEELKRASANAMTHAYDEGQSYIYFVYIAADNEFRGRGLAPALARPMYDTGDYQALPIMLESSNPHANDERFAKAGFAFIAEHTYVEAGVNELEQPVVLTIRAREPQLPARY